MIRVILDASAIAMYAARDPQSMSVSELIGQVAENLGLVGIPATAYLAAYQVSAPGARLILEDAVTSTPSAIRLLPLHGEDVVNIAPMADRMSLDKAHAVIESIRYDAYVASYDLSPMGDYLDPEDLIELSA